MEKDKICREVPRAPSKKPCRSVNRKPRASEVHFDGTVASFPSFNLLVFRSIG